MSSDSLHLVPSNELHVDTGRHRLLDYTVLSLSVRILLWEIPTYKRKLFRAFIAESCFLKESDGWPKRTSLQEETAEHIVGSVESQYSY